MTDNTENLMLEHLKCFQVGQDRIEKNLMRSSVAWEIWSLELAQHPASSGGRFFGSCAA